MTNSRFKDFGTGSGSDASKEPLSFKLYGEEYRCVPQVQGKLILDLVADSSANDPVKAAGVVTTFFKQVVLDEDYDRFQELLTDKNRIVTVETLAEITAWLVEEYSGRPTEGPEVS